MIGVLGLVDREDAGHSIVRRRQYGVERESSSTRVEPRRRLPAKAYIYSEVVASEVRKVIETGGTHGNRWNVMADIRQVDQLKKAPAVADESESPNEAAAFAARRILLALFRSDLRPTRILTSRDGGFVIAFVRDGRYADLECLNTGEILAVISGHGSAPKVWQVTETELPEAIDRVRAFLS